MDINNLDIHDPKSLIEYGNDFCIKSAKYKRRQERQWLINILFIIGDQLCDVNERTGGIDRIKIEDDPDYVVRVINNRVMPIYRTMVAKLTKNKPLPLCTANSREENDIQAARASTKLLMNHWLNLELDEGHQEIAGWLVATGNVFVKQFYNPNKGQALQLDTETATKVKEMVYTPTEDGEKPDTKTMKILDVLDTSQISLGDTDLLIRNPFNCYPQPGKSRLKKMGIFVDSEFLSPEEIYDKYEEIVEHNSASSERSIYSIGIGDIINTGEFDFETTNDSLIEVREIYILPNRKFRKGLTYRWAGDKILGEVKEECKEIPLEHIGFIRVPGKFWCEALVTDLISMQRRWNELLSKIEMHNDLYNDPPIIVDPNTINIDEWEARPGLLLERLLTGMNSQDPWVMPVPALDQAIFQELNILDKQFEIVPVLNKVSFGKDTPNARSGLAINYLQEKDDDVIRPLIVELETSFTKIFKRDFRLCQDNYNEDRGIAIVGKDNKVEWLEFLKSNLTANIDVKVEPGSAMPRSIAAQQAMILELMDRGFFIDPKTGQMDYGRISRYMEFGGIEEMYEDVTLNVDHARRCIEKLKSGIPVLVQDWFDVNTHLYEINRFRKTTSYDDLDDEVRFMVDNYALQCLALVQPPSIMSPDGTEIPLLGESTRPTSTSGPNGSGVSSTPVAPPSAGSVSTPPVTTTPPAGGGPLGEDEIRAILSRLKVLKPDLWKQIKKMDPTTIAGMLATVMQSSQQPNTDQ